MNEAWLDIATAPQDGTLVELLTQSDCVVVGKWGRDPLGESGWGYEHDDCEWIPLNPKGWRPIPFDPGF